MNLNALDIGEKKYSVTISWNPYTAIENVNYKISINNNVIIENLDDISNIINLNTGTFETIRVSINNISPNIHDSIIIFTRPISTPIWKVDPFGNLGLQIKENRNILNWTPSNDDDINSLIIYKTSTTPEFLIESNGMPSENIWEQEVNLKATDTTHTDVKEVFSANFCYVIKTIDSQNNYRYSYIVCDSQYKTIITENIVIENISNDINNRILINWKKYQNNDFYKYVLHRSSDKLMPEDSTEVLAEIIDHNQVIFDDRKNIGNGKTWYYKLELVNQFGLTKSSSIKSGKSRP